jgi:hypothetical protein
LLFAGFYTLFVLVFFQGCPHLGFKLTPICFRPYGRRRGEIMKTTIELPLLPLRDVVVYPHMVIPLFVGREKSLLTTILVKTHFIAWVRLRPFCSC